MCSRVCEGASTIALQFTDKANPDLIATTVERQVNSVVTKIDLSALPVMQLAVVSDTLSGIDLFAIADQTLSPEFQKVNGFSQASLVGGQKQEIQVAIDPYKLAGYGVSLAQLQTALGNDNLSAPAGTLESGPTDYNLQVSALSTRPEDLANTSLVERRISQSISTTCPRSASRARCPPVSPPLTATLACCSI